MLKLVVIVVAVFAATLGATAAFLVGRYLARDWVARKIEGNARCAPAELTDESGGRCVRAIG